MLTFLSAIHVSRNNLHIKYPPLASPKPITGTRRREPPPRPPSACVNVCGLTLNIHPTPTTLSTLHFFLLEILCDLNPDMRDKVQFPRRRAYCRSRRDNNNDLRCTCIHTPACARSQPPLHLTRKENRAGIRRGSMESTTRRQSRKMMLL